MPCPWKQREVQSDLKNVKQIAATASAFAAICDRDRDGELVNVVTWGNPSWGGDCSEVQHELKD